MKRTLLLTVLFTALLFIGHTHAQSSRDSAYRYRAKDTLSKVSYGIKLGAQFNQITGNLDFQQSYVPGIVGGAFIASTRKKWGIQADALVSTSRYNSDSGGSYFSIVYINIEVLPEYEIIHNLWLQLGPAFSSFISVNRTPTTPIDAKNYFQQRDFSGVIGLEAKLPKHFIVGAHYILGLSNIKNDLLSATSQSWMTRSIDAYIGYRFK
jgi:Outer membrane protein beta-barrel domain